MYYPNETSWAPLNAPTGAGIMNNDSSVMDVRQGIYDLLELKVLARVNYVDQNNAPVTAEIEVDLSDYVFVKEVYNLLPVNWDYVTDTKTQQNTIFFEQDNNLIEGLTKNWSTFFSVRRRSLENAILTEYRKTNNFIAILTIENDYFDCLFRAKFIPIQQDRHLEIDRSNVDEINKITKTFFKQNDRLISLDNYTSRMKKTLDRLGEPMITVSLIHPDMTTAFEVGDYTTDDYRLVVAEFQYEKDYISANYQFTKHFPNINRFIGVDRSLQPFELPTGFKVLNRTILYKDHLTISKNVSSNVNSTLITPNGALQILKTFDNSYTALPSETALVINPLEVFGEPKGRLQAPGVFNGIENSFLFSFGFNDNIVAGYRLLPLEPDPNDLIDFVKEGYVQAGVPYTQVGGLMPLASFEIKAKRTNSIPVTFNASQTEANTLPIVTWFDQEETYVAVPTNNNLEIFKDPAEILTFNYQLNVFGEDSQIIVGKSFTRLNKLIYDLDEPLYFFPTINEYTQYDNERVITSGAPTLLSTTITGTLQLSITVNNFIPSGTNSYAIATQSGELLLAVNRVDGVLPTTLNFNFSHVRPGTSRL